MSEILDTVLQRSFLTGFAAVCTGAILVLFVTSDLKVSFTCSYTNKAIQDNVLKCNRNKVVLWILHQLKRLSPFRRWCWKPMYQNGKRTKAEVRNWCLDPKAQGQTITQTGLWKCKEGSVSTQKLVSLSLPSFFCWDLGQVPMIHLHFRLTFTCCIFGFSLNLVKQDELLSPASVFWLCRAWWLL